MKDSGGPSAQALFVERHLALANRPVAAPDAARLARLAADTFAIAHYARRHGIGAARKPAAGSGPLPVWGAGGTAEAQAAAFANGLAAEALDFQEVLIDGRNNGHAAVVIVPALMALAGAERVGADRLLHALRAAFAANVVLARALGRGHRTEGPGFRTTALTAPVAAALGGALLVTGDAAIVSNAVGIAAASLPAGLLSAMSPEAGDFSDDKDISVGLSARHAVAAVELARAGLGGPGDALAGPRGWLASYGFGDAAPDALATDPATVDLAAYALKLFPANFGCQCAIRLAIEVARLVPPGEIAAVAVRVKSSSAVSLSARALRSHVAARFSLPYSVASALVRGGSVLADFEGAAFADATVLEMMDRVVLRGDEALEAQHRRDGTFPAEITVTARGGRSVTRRLDTPWAGFTAAAAQAAFAEKVRALLPAPQADALLSPLASGDAEAVLSAILTPAANPETET